MCERRQKNRAPQRRGFTLLEMLLVLALLVVLGGLAYPALEQSLANQSLRSAADRLRAEWARARLRAMETGSVQLFRFALRDRRYRVDSLTLEGLPRNTLTEDTSLALGSPQECADFSSYSTSEQLPEDVTFLDGNVQLDLQAAYYALQLQENDAADLADQTLLWSDPIVFYPDGTTSTATVTIANGHGRCVELSLRGLTGVVTVGKPYTNILIP